jgi:hypothetical protein
VRVLEQSVGERLVSGRLGVAERTGDEPDDGIEDAQSAASSPPLRTKSPSESSSSTKRSYKTRSSMPS